MQGKFPAMLFFTLPSIAGLIWFSCQMIFHGDPHFDPATGFLVFSLTMGMIVYPLLLFLLFFTWLAMVERKDPLPSAAFVGKRLLLLAGLYYLVRLPQWHVTSDAGAMKDVVVALHFTMEVVFVIALVVIAYQLFFKKVE